MDAKASRRILDLAKQQQEEEEGVNEDEKDTSAIAGPSRLPVEMEDAEDAELSEEEEYEEEEFGDEEYEEIVRVPACSQFGRLQLY